MLRFITENGSNRFDLPFRFFLPKGWILCLKNRFALKFSMP